MSISYRLLLQYCAAFLQLSDSILMFKRDSNKSRQMMTAGGFDAILNFVLHAKLK